MTNSQLIDGVTIRLSGVWGGGYVQVLAVIPDQDTFYDLVDSLEDQGLERVAQQICKSRGVRADIVEDFRRYDSALRREDNRDQSQQQLDLIENARYVHQSSTIVVP